MQNNMDHNREASYPKIQRGAAQMRAPSCSSDGEVGGGVGDGLDWSYWRYWCQMEASFTQRPCLLRHKSSHSVSKARRGRMAWPTHL